MKAVDTNVLARLVLDDDATQSALARSIVLEPVWISATVWVELGWVLAKRLKLDRAVVADALSVILSIETVHTADRGGVAWAIDRYRAGADWADMIHLVASVEAAERFVTFDRMLARHAGEAVPLPVETLG